MRSIVQRNSNQMLGNAYFLSVADKMLLFYWPTLLNLVFSSEDSTRQYLATVRAGVRDEKVGCSIHLRHQNPYKNQPWWLVFLPGISGSPRSAHAGFLRPHRDPMDVRPKGISGREGPNPWRAKTRPGPVNLAPGAARQARASPTAARSAPRAPVRPVVSRSPAG